MTDGFAASLFQRLTLGNARLTRMTFDIEAAWFGKTARALECEPPVFVVGLARAGTTALLRALFAQGRFATLTFRDMPFLLAPNLWSRLGANRNVARTERGQLDGITQDLDSPEALEETFWRSFDGPRYIASDRLLPYDPPRDTLEAYRLYVRLILLRHGGSRYLAKNNNNLLRLDGLVRAYPQGVLLHPFRDPVQHASSLRDQHLQAIRTQSLDPSRLRHMTHLAHHEFGLGHRPFALYPDKGHDPDQPDHWLRQWIAAHRFLLERGERVSQRQMFIDMDVLATNPGQAASTIARISESPPQPFPPFRTATDRAPTDFDPQLLDEAKALHNRLVSRAEVVMEP